MTALWEARDHTLFNHTVIKERFLVGEESDYEPVARANRIIIRDNQTDDAIHLVRIWLDSRRPFVGATSEAAFVRIGTLIALHA